MESDRARTEPPRRINADDSDYYQDRLSVHAGTLALVDAAERFWRRFTHRAVDIEEALEALGIKPLPKQEPVEKK